MLLKSCILCVSMAASPAIAEEADTIGSHVAYLSEPTEWCQGDAGVPAVVTFDGPDVYVGEINEDYSPEVRVRRGVESTTVDVGRIPDSEVRTRRGRDLMTLDTTRTASVDPRLDDLTLLGRMLTRLNFCQTMWASHSGSGEWSVTAPDGTVALAGTVEDKKFNGFVHPFFFRSFRSFPAPFKVGDQRFFVLNEPTYERTVEAFVSPAEEQSQ